MVLLPFQRKSYSGFLQKKVVVGLGFTTFLTSQVISIAFYSEHEKSDKFCSETQISAWGCFTSHKSTTWDPRLYFPSEGSHTQDFYALKKIHRPRQVWTANLWFSGKYDNHGTTMVDYLVDKYCILRELSAISCHLSILGGIKTLQKHEIKIGN